VAAIRAKNSLYYSDVSLPRIFKQLTALPFYSAPENSFLPLFSKIYLPDGEI
jgi:hypothetical protein